MQSSRNSFFKSKQGQKVPLSPLAASATSEERRHRTFGFTFRFGCTATVTVSVFAVGHRRWRSIKMYHYWKFHGGRKEGRWVKLIYSFNPGDSCSCPLWTVCCVTLFMDAFYVTILKPTIILLWLTEPVTTFTMWHCILHSVSAAVIQANGLFSL